MNFLILISSKVCYLKREFINYFKIKVQLTTMSSKSFDILVDFEKHNDLSLFNFRIDFMFSDIIMVCITILIKVGAFHYCMCVIQNQLAFS